MARLLGRVAPELCAMNYGLLAAALVAALRASGAELQVAHEWPQLPAGQIMGQVSGLGCDSRGDVFVFHRASRAWIPDPTSAGPIAEPTVCRFHGKTGRLLAQWGARIFLLPHGLFVDHRDHVWLTDVGRHQVFEFDHDGKLLREWGVKGIGGNDETHFNKPTDIAVLPDGSFYVSDGYVNSRVVKFSSEGKFQFQWGGKGSAPGEFLVPHGIAVDRSGKVYVADRENDPVQVFSPDGRFLAQWKHPAMGRPYGLRISNEGLLYVADGGEQPAAPPNRSGVAVLDLDGKIVATFGRWGNYDGQFMMAHDIALSNTGEIYVGDIDGRRVQKLTWTGAR
ncbi:MAG: 6-bladed beta-propeller [Verrucomicrobia bacterium]|nr:6-bladed beta-propeller [Verrucomicrobiota bacterium]